MAEALAQPDVWKVPQPNGRESNRVDSLSDPVLWWIFAGNNTLFALSIDARMR